MLSARPLSSKIIRPLFALQVTAVSLGIGFLAYTLQQEQVHQSRERVDLLADALADAVRPNGKTATFDASSSLVAELGSDPDVYAVLLGRDDVPIATVGGLAVEHRRALVQRQMASQLQPEESHTLEVEGQWWQVQREPLALQASMPERHSLLVAINVSTQRRSLLHLCYRLIACGAGIVLLTLAGTWWIVSHSTNGLRRFATSLNQIRPEAPSWQASEPPACAEEQVLQANFSRLVAAIGQSAQAQRLFIADASHELKTPIAAMLTTLEVVLTKPRLANVYERCCFDLLKTVQDMHQLTATLLDLARLDVARQDEQIGGQKLTSLKTLLAALELRWVTSCEEQGVTLAVDRPPAEARVAGDAGLLLIALGNLLDNSLKYAASGRLLEVRVRAPAVGLNRSWGLVIRDHGPGLQPADLARLGEVFFRADPARHSSQSYGLGYAQAQRLLNQMGATLTAATGQSSGLELLIEWPMI